jgi:hypothetical protein
LTDPDVEVAAWQFLIDASRVSFGTMTSPAASTMETSTLNA